MESGSALVLVTGGGSGMGRLAAERHIRAGHTVALLDVNEAGMADTGASSDRVHRFCVDVSDTDAVLQVIATIVSELGHIDRLYHAAAIMPFGKLLDQNPRQQLKVMDVNYGGLVNVATAALPGMIQRGQGDFISFSSMAGIVPGLLMGAYCSSKFAVQAYTEILYHENRDSGVRFACVCPPAVATPLLKQAEATVQPKMIFDQPVIAPEEVLDEIEQCLQKGEFLVFPGKASRTSYRIRRYFPGLIWKHSHKAEGF